MLEYVALAERYLGFQQPGFVYGFADDGDDHKRVCGFMLFCSIFGFLCDISLIRAFLSLNSDFFWLNYSLNSQIVVLFGLWLVKVQFFTLFLPLLVIDPIGILKFQWGKKKNCSKY